MRGDYTIFAVDDVETARRLLEVGFAKDYAFESFGSAEECLARLQASVPDLLLLDVELPGMDGYELCRKIKGQAALANFPVIFISSRDDLESRLQGYEAGGIDFLVKPYNIPELRQKVDLALATSSDKSTLIQQMEDSETLTSLVMANLDEYALLIKFLRTINECPDYRGVAQALLDMLGSYKLESAVQVRVGSFEFTLGAAGENSPLEVSVIRHVRSLGRIFEFKNRAAFNFHRLTVLVNNMPIEDSDLCGRLRDHLAIAVESADAKLENLQNRADKERTEKRVGQMLKSVTEAVSEFSRKYDSARYQGTELTESMLDQLLRAFTNLAMTDTQEEHILSIVRSKAYDLVELYDFGDETQETLKALVVQLNGVLGIAESGR